ncbi:hypothetical protein FEM48_Zijuj10G0022700 [Ziziphus jujuba var. spinosa]|uniref:Uncharacterized protein n=1 Tax=Ziziphus jujuba var. spinosa TaxID=714518 RepID=A0A978UKQ0_ZIZJJ|nr:hypothetical protein FEM48_Zijuj10G0022700 [Ziziphus jujuba var. spinosa]
MGVNLRQDVAGILTLTMFAMLGNLIERDHFDSVEEKFPGDRSVLDNAKNLKQGLVTLAEPGRGPWRADVEELKPCWSRALLDDVEDTDGYVIFSLTNGPEYYVSQLPRSTSYSSFLFHLFLGGLFSLIFYMFFGLLQIADAVVVARYLGATLVLPDIRGSNPGDERVLSLEVYTVDMVVITSYKDMEKELDCSLWKSSCNSAETVVLVPRTLRSFEEVYDVPKFVNSLDGVVRVAKKQPANLSTKNLAVVKVPNRVTEDYISESPQ